MQIAWERAQSLTMTLAALAIAGVLIHREFAPDRTAGPAPNQTVAQWRDIANSGRTFGDTAAQVKVIEFADLECPFCREYQGTLQTAARKYQNKNVAFVFVHLPLRIHRFAQPAARAAECAAGQGRFGEMVDALYKDQESYGVRSWAAFAAAAGVPDTVVFNHCIEEAGTVPEVQRGLDVAKRFDVHATPTIMVNNLRFGSAPSEVELYRAIDKALSATPR